MAPHETMTWGSRVNSELSGSSSLRCGAMCRTAIKMAFHQLELSSKEVWFWAKVINQSATVAVTAEWTSGVTGGGPNHRAKLTPL